MDTEHTVAEQSEVRSNIRTGREADETQSERQTEFSETHMQEEPNEGAAMEVQEEEKKERETSDDCDEIVSSFSEPVEPPPTPPEGVGLQFRHKHPSLTLRHILTVTKKKPMINI